MVGKIQLIDRKSAELAAQQATAGKANKACDPLAGIKSAQERKLVQRAWDGVKKEVNTAILEAIQKGDVDNWAVYVGSSLHAEPYASVSDEALQTIVQAVLDEAYVGGYRDVGGYLQLAWTREKQVVPERDAIIIRAKFGGRGDFGQKPFTEIPALNYSKKRL